MTRPWWGYGEHGERWTWYRQLRHLCVQTDCRTMTFRNKMVQCLKISRRSQKFHWLYIYCCLYDEHFSSMMCMYARTAQAYEACMIVCIYIYTCTRIYTRPGATPHLYAYTCMNIYARAYMSARWLHSRMHTRTWFLPTNFSCTEFPEPTAFPMTWLSSKKRNANQGTGRIFLNRPPSRRHDFPHRNGM